MVTLTLQIDLCNEQRQGNLVDTSDIIVMMDIMMRYYRQSEQENKKYKSTLLIL